ncbi:hypothetical protein [Tenacibaculum singaporense]|uniref:hypothetical protein n=1 Tax=Tenacibaculum singaporense TaxID=2358479 RepID=UPI000F671398|nr:hypothetical protein [Tenacibaculum singaporense]RSC95886.1 hypothetical protein EI424_01885 [Tenacibaculum singaporense]
MKKIILLLGLVTLFSCSNENNVYDEQVINIQIVEIPNEYKEKYTFSDLKVDVYLKLDDYFNEKNSFFSSNVDNEGKITISKNIQFGTRYYIDIYTEDRILSNWKPTDLNVDSSNTIVFGSGGNINNFLIKLV